MKRTIALLTVITMLFSVPHSAFANQQKADALENIILKVRERIDIPADHEEFSGDMRTDENGKVIWSLNWRRIDEKDDLNNSYISVEVEDSGFIRSYSKSTNFGRDYSEIVKLPQIPKETADGIVKDFIAKVCPEIEGQYVWKEPSIYDGNYSYSFPRIVNGINVPTNNVYFNIDSALKEITQYNCYWNTGLEFSLPEKAITEQKAQEIFSEKTPLDLEYSIDSKGQVSLRYIRSREKGDMYINAITGDVEKPQYDNLRYAAGYAGEMAVPDLSSAKKSLRPEEQKEVDNIAGTISAAQAEKKLRALTELDFDDEYKLTSTNLSQEKMPYSDERFYRLNMYFTRLKQDEDVSDEKRKLMIAAGEGDGYANAVFNAKTGELLSFSSGSWDGLPRPVSTDVKAKGEEDKHQEMQKVAEAFIKKMQPDKLSKTKPMDLSNQNKPYYYNYYRIENGAYFGYDQISASVNVDNAKINEYSCNWTEGIEVPSADGVIGIDKAHEILFNTDALNLEYLIFNNKAVLAYKISDDKYFNIDAKTGELVDWEGKPYVENLPASYNDIEGHFSETAIKELAAIGIFLSGESFLPDENIAQRDFVTLLVKLGRYYYDRENIDTIYNYLIRQGVMDETEKTPDTTVTREDSIKYLLRYLGYKNFAEIPGIFVCDFSDVNEINPGLLGYAAIAQGLGIVKGSNGAFAPKDALTRGETAVIIFKI